MSLDTADAVTPRSFEAAAKPPRSMTRTKVRTSLISVIAEFRSIILFRGDGLYLRAKRIPCAPDKRRFAAIGPRSVPMRLIQFDVPGPPDVLQCLDVPVPEPKAGEVLVRANAI